jgi:aminoglycoside/choline kinase family phosphotransferase
MDQPSELKPDLDTRIQTYLTEAGLTPRVRDIVPLTGDASDRRYLRVLLSGDESVVLAVYAGAIEFATLPFASVAELFRQMPLPVPTILGHSDAEGVVALQDLGDVTLQSHLSDTDAADRMARYREAVALIDLLQRRGSELASGDYLPYRVSFDVPKLTWELNFFVRHFVEAYRGVALSEAERHGLDAEWEHITRDLAAESDVVCHRDYHSRNLMVHHGRLFVIDFQDARLGPDTYDLVSLLRDSYVDISDDALDELIAFFLELKDNHDAETFRLRFDLMAVQRNLKALGTFGYQTTAKGNAVYVQHMPRTLRYLRANLHKHRRFSGLLKLLAPHLEELG